ncbi:hypothetical protein BX600DRAFT_453966 [Xylariales sp. PMI_506]|nr:hypothetical protein BX600DRAFT_453966 [Xylariales sp. PMI_506]
MDPGHLQDDTDYHLKRRRIDSGFGDLSQSSRASSLGLKRRESQVSSGKRPCSPILLSDDLEPEVVITQETKYGPAEPHVTIYLGSEKQQIPQSKFLAHVWKHGLDSPCMVCHCAFEANRDDPPIRTFTFESSEDAHEDAADITRVPVAPHPIRFFNRHLSCISNKRIPYVPISHVWHQPVSEAQMKKISSMAAARLAFQIPVQTLTAVTKKLGPLEIWHDYLSVPQWLDEVQQELLLRIPTIFSFPAQMIMHLDDVQSCHLQSVEDPLNYTTFIDGISTMTKSRWFDRMWVALEYIQAKEVLIMTQYYEVYDRPAADMSALAGVHLGKYIKRLGQDRFSQMATSKGFQWQRRASWDDMETWKTIDPKYRTLGSAIFIIGQKQCRDQHDYFFALRGLLRLGHGRTEINTIMSDSVFESCLDLNWDALKSGDYSPLLFIPPNDELVDHRVPWLRGHVHISQKLWDLGTCRKLAKHQTLIQDGVIKPKLESIGMVCDFEYFDFTGSPESIVQRICSKFLQIHDPASKHFIAAIDRILPSASRKGLFSSIGATSSNEGSHETEIHEYNRIETILGRIHSINNKFEQQRELHQLSKKLIALIGLSLPDKNSHVSRIKSAMDEAQFFDSKKEGLASVTCRGCTRGFLYRVTAWEDLPAGNSELYRIPGLLFDDTVPEGVGIVVSDGRIVGRLAYATPACDCRTASFVELGRRPRVPNLKTGNSGIVERN